MPYHSEVIGMSWEQLTPEFQLLIFAFMKAFGVTWIPFFLNQQTGANTPVMVAILGNSFQREAKELLNHIDEYF